MGFLRPKVLLYGEDCPDKSAITAAFNDDLREPVDTVLIVGTRLLIPLVMNFAKRLSKNGEGPGSCQHRSIGEQSATQTGFAF